MAVWDVLLETPVAASSVAVSSAALGVTTLAAAGTPHSKHHLSHLAYSLLVAQTGMFVVHPVMHPTCTTGRMQSVTSHA